jgi:hypothetical protein
MVVARGRWSRQDADPTVTAMVVAASADVSADGRPDALFAVGLVPEPGLWNDVPHDGRPHERDHVD